MSHSFIAFIDESGDDGLSRFRQPGKNGGASRWLVVSAILFRRTNDLEAVRWRDEIMNLMPQKKRRDIHFKDMNHNQRVMAAQILSKKPIRSISVLSNKASIPEATFTQKNQLYFYLTRHLIERISWACRDLRPSVPEGDGRVAITFSRRGGMSYEQFGSYLRRLRNDLNTDTSIHWPMIDISGIQAKDHSTSASLQLADIVASSFAAAVEPDLYGNCESRYAELLKPIVYNKNSNYLSYGVKLLSSSATMLVDSHQQKLTSIYS